MPLADGLRLQVNALDYVLLIGYFAVVLMIGFLARRAVRTSNDFFLSGRSLPAWITGLAFISANLGALEILGQSANGAQYGIAAVHFYWIGAIPAMIFLAIVMMPFYYGSRVHSVPEFLRRRFNNQTHLLNALTFALSTILQAGVNLFALSIVIHALLGWPTWLSIVVAGAIVLAYITLGGLSGAIYNEVLQFFVILAGLIPIVVVGMVRVGGFNGLKAMVVHNSPLGQRALATWAGTGVGHPTNPLGDWIGIVFGLGFVLGFGYWTTNFVEVQRAFSAKDYSAARRTPLIGAFPKTFFPLLTILPGLLAIAIIPAIAKGTGGLTYNDAIPALIGELLPNGVLGIAITGLLASFMAGMAANVSAFNTVWTYDFWRPYIVRDRDDSYYLRHGRIMTVIGVIVAIGTAFIADQFTNLQNYIQLLFSYFNAPLFATFLLAILFVRITPWGGFWGLLSGMLGAVFAHFSLVGWVNGSGVLYHIESPQSQNFYTAIFAFLVDVVVTVGVSLFTAPKPSSELGGLVWGRTDTDTLADSSGKRWWENVWLLSTVVAVITIALSIAVSHVL